MGGKFKPDNQGEGNRDAARRYNQRAEEHVLSGRSEEAAESALGDLEGPDADELRQAEREGKRRVAEEDPEVEALLDDDDRNAERGID